MKVSNWIPLKFRLQYVENQLGGHKGPCALNNKGSMCKKNDYGELESISRKFTKHNLLYIAKG